MLPDGVHPRRGSRVVRWRASRRRCWIEVDEARRSNYAGNVPSVLLPAATTRSISSGGGLCNAGFSNRPSKPRVPIFGRRQNHRHRLRVNRAPHLVRFGRQKREEFMSARFSLPVAGPWAPDACEGKKRCSRREQTNVAPWAGCRSIRKRTLPERGSAIPS